MARVDVIAHTGSGLFSPLTAFHFFGVTRAHFFRRAAVVVRETNDPRSILPATTSSPGEIHLKTVGSNRV